MAKQSNLVGSWAFLIGVVIAVGFGALGEAITGNLLWILVVLGLVVGLINITGDEVGQFLMASAVLLIAASFGKSVVETVPMMLNILNALLLLFVLLQS